jgi:hypothetical protein
VVDKAYPVKDWQYLLLALTVVVVVGLLGIRVWLLVYLHGCGVGAC